MSNLIQLGRVPKSPEDREALIAEEAAKEERMAGMGLSHVRRAVVDFLLSEKGYANQDIELEKEFCVKLGDGSFKVKSDILLKIDGRAFLLVKCAMTSPDSWERYAVAMGRAACEETIPFCLVTDGEIARLIDVRTGEGLTEDFDRFPTRQQALAMLAEFFSQPFICKKPEMEKRILSAFEGISCLPPDEKL